MMKQLITTNLSSNSSKKTKGMYIYLFSLELANNEAINNNKFIFKF